MSTAKKLFGTNGVRGLANVELTPDMAIKISLAIGTFFGKKNLLLGYDARTSGPMLSKAVTSGLIATGCNVYSTGMAPTPSLQFAVKNHKMNGGIIITASHNPAEYNGIKVIWSDGIEISHEQEAEIEKIYFDNKTIFAPWNNLGELKEISGINEEYIAAIKKHVNTGEITKKQFHIVVDAANSVGGLTTPTLMRELGCRVTSINANIDGTFPGRDPEPCPESLGDLAATVKAIGADIGVAFDGDADRSIFVDENGEIYMGDKTFAVVLKQFLLENKGATIVTPVSSSTLIKDIIDAYGGKVEWTKVGSVTVSQKMKEINAKLGGEENGGVFYGPHQAVRDGAMTTALLLEIMAKTGKKLSELIAEQPQYFIEKSKIECSNKNKTALQTKIYEQVKNENISTIDGIKIWFNDKSAILIRASGTEPVYRLYAEAKSQERALKIVAEYSSKLRELLQTL
ncbi:MAG: phosphoglucosamine mutase [Candidatus Bathyarchaeota archaeon]|uniref:phosphoglucosamine mutase n=1 Tax=Candidatus Bathycorpusculum sp. TaxID=2994959 RepID=UPI0028204F0D|nr:phosphoglucosamine mutase [Candidatus Termiticorpusculum sp.]MCL2257796.1 phosphoglucosamine mutase [Candidatus Termiticorpusculum sp.]MCL2291846.1 phosphoglucosamine mutase [Candidatus Termiticorpusculum sp.]